MRRLVIIVVIMSIFYSIQPIAAHAQKIFSRPAQSILDLAFSPDGKQIAKVYANGKVEVLTTYNNEILFQSILDEELQLWSAKAAWSPHGNQLSVGIGATIYIWKVTDQKLELIEQYAAGGNNEAVYFENSSYLPEGFVSLEWDITGTLLMAKSVSSRLTVWSTTKQAFIADQILGTNPIPVVWLPDNLHIASIDSIFDIQTQTIDFRSPDQIKSLSSACNASTSFESSNSGQLIVQGTYTGCVVIIDANTGEELAGFKITDVPINDAHYSSDGTQIIAVDRKGYVRVVEIATGAFTVVDQIDGELYAVDWSAANNQIAYGGIYGNQNSFYISSSLADIENLMRSKTAHQSEIAVTPSPDDS